MILKDGTKHACRSCITGHRSSKCVHHDRELFPIAKKGRPSTQCKACKQRGTTHSGRCECQGKRKPKSQMPGAGEAGSSSQAIYASDGMAPRKDSSGASHFSSMPPSEDGAYAHSMQPYPTGMMDGTSTHATNSSASSPSYSQQTFALTQPPMDPHMLPGGLPFPQPDPHFAYAYHPSAQGDHHLDLPPPRNMAAGVVRSRPPTAGEEEVPWWMYRAGYSPNPGHPYEPPPPVGHPAEGSHLQSATPGIYSDYTQYLAQPSPFMLGTPGAGPGHQNSPAFVWHNNATSYRDYMATQQADNYHNLSSAQASHQIPRSQEGHQHQQPTLPAPSLHHHHSVPYLQTSTSVTAANPAPHSAPLPLSSVSDAHGRPSQQEEKDRDWRRSHVHDSHSGGHYALATTNDHRGHEVDFRRDMQHSEGDLRVDRVPSLGYESGSCRMTSSDSIPSVHRLPTPISIGTIADRGMHRYDSKDYSQSNVQLHDAPLRERRSTSFDQVISRASPINLKMPEDRQKRKFTSEI